MLIYKIIPPIELECTTIKINTNVLAVARASFVQRDCIAGSNQRNVQFKGELNPKIKFALFERTLKITE